MSPNEPTRSLESRLHHLERANRRLTLALAGLALLGLVAFATPRPQVPATQGPEVVAANRFELVDEAGHVRGRWLLEGRHPALVLTDEDGKDRVWLGHNDQQTALYLKDADGAVRVGAAQFAHGGGGYALHGAEGKGTSVLYQKDGRGRLSFYDVAGNLVEQLEPPKEGENGPGAKGGKKGD